MDNKLKEYLDSKFENFSNELTIQDENNDPKICKDLKQDIELLKTKTDNNISKIVCLKNYISNKINSKIKSVREKGFINSLINLSNDSDDQVEFNIGDMVTINKKLSNIMCLEFRKYQIYYSTNIKNFINKYKNYNFPNGEIIDQSFDKSMFLIKFSDPKDKYWFNKQDIVHSDTYQSGGTINIFKRSKKKKNNKKKGGSCKYCNLNRVTLYPPPNNTSCQETLNNKNKQDNTIKKNFRNENIQGNSVHIPFVFTKLIETDEDEDEDKEEETQEEGNESQKEGNESQKEGNESQKEGNESQKEGNESQKEGKQEVTKKKRKKKKKVVVIKLEVIVLKKKKIK